MIGPDIVRLVFPDPPACSFASDNTAGAHPAVIEALAAANDGPAVAYGDDPWTTRASDAIRAVFETDAEVLFAWGGTGANIVGLQAMLAPRDAIVCASSAHINVDECGAPERFLGAKLIDLDTPDGKLHPGLIEAEQVRIDGARGVVHHVQPRVLALTQATETGQVYSLAELDALIEAARVRDMLVHVDGARLANAISHLGCDPARVVQGVDVLSFGGTKNGLVHGEAIVLLRPDLVEAARFAQKQAAQLPSKMRYIAAQFSALLQDGRWLELAGHANAMAARLAAGVDGIHGVDLRHRPQANAVFAVLEPDVIDTLTRWTPFYVWDPAINEVRWMTSWQTTEADVDRFLEGVAIAAGAV
ncbi:MAG: beta-eliminating lyase-related protein [Acidimicrobiia bacterium]|nr:beta-eliminating lyase-related protein [Acidimicrobiia bacterium]